MTQAGLERSDIYHQAPIAKASIPTVATLLSLGSNTIEVSTEQYQSAPSSIQSDQKVKTADIEYKQNKDYLKEAEYNRNMVWDIISNC